MKFSSFFLIILIQISLWGQTIKIMIDPGHGGVDNGAVHNGIREANLTLTVSKKLYELLNNDPRFEVKLTRESTAIISLEDRANSANQWMPDLFLSIHANSSPDIRARGSEFYFQNTLPADQFSLFLASKENNDETKGSRPTQFAHKYKGNIGHILDDMYRNHYIEESHNFARHLKQTWMEELGGKKPKIRQAPFYVVSSINTPSLLVELGYLTHPSEVKRLKSNYYQNRIAKTLYNALKKYNFNIQ